MIAYTTNIVLKKTPFKWFNACQVIYSPHTIQGGQSTIILVNCVLLSLLRTLPAMRLDVTWRLRPLQLSLVLLVTTRCCHQGGVNSRTTTLSPVHLKGHEGPSDKRTDYLTSHSKNMY